MNLVDFYSFKPQYKIALDVESGRVASLVSAVPLLQMQFTAFASQASLNKKIRSSELVRFSYLKPQYKIALDVESGRVELPSKQATKMLSTRLVSD